MPWQAVAAGGSAVGNIISQYMANQNNIQLQEMANAHNSQLAQEQRQWDYEMWLKQNEYNDPQAQMERLRAAGINPALAYSNGGLQNEAAPAVPAAGSRDQAARVVPYQVDPLLMAQVANINADTRKKNLESDYQNYLNQVEDALANSPLGSVVVVSPDGSESVEVQYGNARVEFARRELDAIGLSNGLDKVALNDLIYNLAVLTGSDSYSLSEPNSIASSELPGYEEAVAALRGDQQVRYLSGELARLSKDAADADKAGRAAYAAWLKEHGDEPIVKFMLTLQGFIQTLGIHLPAFGGTTTTQGHYDGNSHFVPRRTRSWFFGGRR